MTVKKLTGYKNKRFMIVMHSNIRKITSSCCECEYCDWDDVKVEPVASHKYLFISTCPNFAEWRKMLGRQEFGSDAGESGGDGEGLELCRLRLLVITGSEHMTKI